MNNLTAQLANASFSSTSSRTNSPVKALSRRGSSSDVGIRKDHMRSMSLGLGSGSDRSMEHWMEPSDESKNTTYVSLGTVLRLNSMLNSGLNDSWTVIGSYRKDKS